MSQTTEFQDDAPEGYKRVQLGPRTLPVPTDWEVKRVDEITENLDNKREPIKSSERESGDIPYYGATGQVDSVSDHLFDEKLVLVGEDGADWSPFGGTSYIISGKSWVNNHVHVLKCTNIVEEFFSNYLDYIEMRHVISGTNRGKLNQSELNQFPVLFPSLPEQRRIADILRTVDEQIQQTGEIIEETKKMKRGIGQDLYGNDVSDDQFPDRAPELPEGWSLRSISDLCDIGGGKTPSKSNDEYWEGTVLWASPKDFDGPLLDDTEDKITEYGVNNTSLKTYSEGDIAVVVRSGVLQHTLPVAKLTSKSTVNQDIKVLQPNKDVVDPEYLFHILRIQSNRIRQLCMKTGTTVQSIETSFLEKYKLRIPPRKKQEKIAGTFGNLDQKIRLEQSHLSKLKELKRGLMQDLLTGKVRVDAD